jgi:hypothetical protein
MPQLRQSAIGISERRSRFIPRKVNVGFVVNKMTVGQAVLRELQFSH